MELDLFGPMPDAAEPLVDALPARIRLGTCSWSYKDWAGPFYHDGAKPKDFLQQYAQHFRAVEIDSTFYATPPRTTVRGWGEKTPEDFRFTAKVPKLITHEAQMVRCEESFAEFIDVMGELGPKLGPLLLQFPYYAKATRPPLDEFVGRLDALLCLAPPGVRIAVEVRNRTWLAPPLLDCLKTYRAALALIAHPWMPEPEELPHLVRQAAANFLYVRWLGDRKGMEQITTRWNETVLDRTAEIRAWADLLASMPTPAEIWGFFNNHFAGFSPESIRIFAQTWLSRKATEPS